MILDLILNIFIYREVQMSETAFKLKFYLCHTYTQNCRREWLSYSAIHLLLAHQRQILIPSLNKDILNQKKTVMYSISWLRLSSWLSVWCVKTLLPAASLLQLNGVRDACCKFLLSQLDPSNCLGIRGFADTHSCSDLLKSAHKYVLQHFVEVSKTEEFMLLPLKQVRMDC